MTRPRWRNLFPVTFLRILSSKETQVGMLLAYTPDEWDLPLEGTVARGTVRQARPKSQKKAG